MEQSYDILTFRDWKENSIGFVFAQGAVSVISLQKKKKFLTGNHDLRKKLENKHKVSHILLKIYRNNFDWIQEQHQLWLEQNT